MIVDLSVPIEDSPSEPIRPQVDFEDHDRTAPLVAGIFGCDVSDLPRGKGWASETVTLITHAGTHVDAPYHYFPTCDGERARTIDELPLDWFVRPGVRLDLRDVERGAEIRIADLERAAELVRGEPDEIEPDGAPNRYNVPRTTLQFNIHYHLGLARYLKGDFEGALDAYRACMDVATNDDMIVAVADWMYMTLRRLGRDQEEPAAGHRHHHVPQQRRHGVGQFQAPEALPGRQPEHARRLGQFRRRAGRGAGAAAR